MQHDHKIRKMKRILYLTFYFRPDLCAGSFRNSPLLYELARQAKAKGLEVDVMTTLPNRYSSYSQEAPEVETYENIRIERIAIPGHKSGIKDQMLSFTTFFKQVKKRIKDRNYDMVFASSSRLFTAFLGYRIARRRKIPLYLDIRDIFVDTMKEVLKSEGIKAVSIPVLKKIEKQTFSYASHINLISPGFKPYFSNYNHAAYSYFTNGIDEVFLEANKVTEPLPPSKSVKKIVYAGNIGEGQGLEKIVPEVAALLGEDYELHIIGDGGTRKKLEEAIHDQKLNNIHLRPPMSRDELIKEYKKADYLFMHLNDYEAFKKVLPSKIFELAMFNKPLLAGVNGYARHFIQENLPDSILFTPGNAEELAKKIKEKEQLPFEKPDRSNFTHEFSRQHINQQMAASILELIGY